MNTKEEALLLEIVKLIEKFEEAKPGDRSPLDRVYAVTTTKLEDAFAYFKVWGIEAAESVKGLN